jgi:hypothetical protein
VFNYVPSDRLKYVPVKPKIDTNSEFTMWSMVLVWEIRKKQRAIRGLKLDTAHIAIEYVCVFSCLAWLLAPFVKQCLDAWDLEDGGDLLGQREVRVFHNGRLDNTIVIAFGTVC